MKQRLAAWIVAAMGMLPAADATACFEVGGLTLSVYNATDAEVGYNLGIDLATHDFASTQVITVQIDKSDFGGSLAWADLRAGVYGYSGTVDNHVFFATTTSTAPSVSTRSWAAFMGADDQVKAYYNGVAPQTPVAVLAADVASYWTKMDSAATPGQYAGVNTSFADGEASLAALGTTGHTDMYLYKVNKITGVVPGASGDYQCVVRIQAGTPAVIYDPVIDPIVSQSAFVGAPYTGPTPTLSQGTAPIVWELVSGPAGMLIGNPATGVVQWDAPVLNTPPEAPYVVTLRAANDRPCSEEVSFGLVVTGGQRPITPAIFLLLF